MKTDFALWVEFLDSPNSMLDQPGMKLMKESSNEILETKVETRSRCRFGLIGDRWRPSFSGHELVVVGSSRSAALARVSEDADSTVPIDPPGRSKDTLGVRVEAI